MAEISEITKYIIDKYQKEADSIIYKAKAEYDAGIAEYTAKAQKESEFILENAHIEAKKITDIAMQSAKQEKTKMILALKNEKIISVMKKCKNTIINLPDEEYEKFMLAFLDKYHENKLGEIMISASDKSRQMPEFTRKAENAGLVFSEDTVDISGGFILKYGKVEQNCSIDAIFRENNEEISDCINSGLF